MVLVLRIVLVLADDDARCPSTDGAKKQTIGIFRVPSTRVIKKGEGVAGWAIFE